MAIAWGGAMNHRFLNRNVTFVVLLGLAWAPRVSAELLDSGQLKSVPPTEAVSGAVQAGERLSDWVLRNVPAVPNSYALHWLVAAERGPQLALRNAVVSGLRMATSGKRVVPGLCVSWSHFTSRGVCHLPVLMDIGYKCHHSLTRCWAIVTMFVGFADLAPSG